MIDLAILPRIAHAVSTAQSSAQNLILQHPTLTGLAFGTATMFAGAYTAVAIGEKRLTDIPTSAFAKKIASRGAAWLSLTAGYLALTKNMHLPPSIQTNFVYSQYPYGAILGMLGVIAVISCQKWRVRQNSPDSPTPNP